MSKVITVEELIANIAAHLAEVKNGETLTITANSDPANGSFGPMPERY